MTSPYVLDFLARLQNVKPTGDDKWQACCPAHDDRKQSLSIGIGREEQILLHCFAGCDTDAILDVLNLPFIALFPPKEEDIGKWEEIKGTRRQTAEYSYHQADGTLLFQVLRFQYRVRHSQTSKERMDKDFQQRQPGENGEWNWKTRGLQRVLYRLPQVLEAKERGATIFLVEGEKDVHTLEEWGLTATTKAGGSGAKWEPQYTETLTGANVVILPDNDTAGKEAAQTAANALQGKAASLRVIFLPDLPDKGDVTDWKEAGGTKNELLLLVRVLPEYGAKPDADAPEEDKRIASQKLVRLALSAEFFRNDLEEAFAFVPIADHRETWAVRSKAFKEWLAHRYYEQFGKPAGSQAIEDALRVLEGECRFKGREYTLSLRMAQENARTLWIDLSDADWQAVKVTPNGWSVELPAVPRFRRFKVAAPQKEPKPGGSLDAFRSFLNLRDDAAWMQLVAWLVCAFFPDVAHPILVIHGEMGTAKSTLMRMVSRLVDPSRAELRAEPKDKTEWIQMADHAWLVCLDNLSGVPQWMSDALCRAVTGEASISRMLYTDNEDVLTAFRRCIALTGIEVVAKRPDLLERAILLPLEPIPADQRRGETEVLAAFEAARPAIFGALLDVLSGVLRILPTVQLESLPRMADFARVGVAVGRVLGWQEGAFLKAYTANMTTQHEEALDASPIGDALQVFMDGRDAKDGQAAVAYKEEWRGTATMLLEELTRIVGERMAGARNFPKIANKLSGELKRLAPNLRSVGLFVETRKGKERGIVIFRREQDKEGILSSPSSPSSPSGTSLLIMPENPATIPEHLSSPSAKSIVSSVAETVIQYEEGEI